MSTAFDWRHMRLNTAHSTGFGTPSALRLMLTLNFLFVFAQLCEAQLRYITNNGAITITGYLGNENAEGAVIIPRTINGLPVKQIGNFAFAFSGANLRRVTIEEGVDTIAGHAFYSCSSLSKVIIPSSISEIGEASFGACEKLSELVIDERNINFKVMDGVLFSGDGTQIIQYLIGNGRRAYEVPNGVLKINNLAFESSKNLLGVSISKSVTNIASEAFAQCFNLEEITVDALNTWYMDRDGVLFEGSGMRLMNYPAGNPRKSYEVPDAVYEILSSSFSGARSLTNVNISQQVKIISENAFQNCKNMQQFSVGPLNQMYTSTNGVLYNSDQTRLIRYPQANSRSDYNLSVSAVSIGDHAFEQCSTLTNVNLNVGLRSIGLSAFSSCIGLKTVRIPNSVTNISGSAFFSCSSLLDMDIPNGVAMIGSGAFSGCSSLVRIVIPKSVNSIKSDTFSRCGNLVDVSIPNSVVEIGSSAFNSCASLASILLPESITNISDNLFSNCSALKNITIPDGVICIGNNAFTLCGQITNVFIPDTVKKIGAFSFFLCRNLSDFQIPIGLISIGDHAFEGCDNIKAVSISSNVEKIGTSAFASCSSIQSFAVDKQNALYSSLDDVLFNKDLTQLIAYPTANLRHDYVIPSSVTSIDTKAFYGAYNLFHIQLSENLRFIESFAFSNCRGLIEMNIPDSVENVGDSAFAGCAKMSVLNANPFNRYYSSRDGVLFSKDFSVLIQYPNGSSRLEYSIPDEVTTMSPYAFQSASMLQHLMISRKVSKISYSSFIGCGALARFTVSEENDSFTSYNGVLFDRTKSELVHYPKARRSSSFTIPASVTSVRVRSFETPTFLKYLFFEGNNPGISSSGVLFVGSSLTLYYLAGNTGWGPRIGGRPAVLWNPTIQQSDGTFGLRNGVFGFTISGTAGIPVIVDAIDDLAQTVWMRVGAITLTGGSSYFSDPQWASHPNRVYRLRGE